MFAELLRADASGLLARRARVWRRVEASAWNVSTSAIHSATTGERLDWSAAVFLAAGWRRLADRLSRTAA